MKWLSVSIKADYLLGGSSSSKIATNRFRLRLPFCTQRSASTSQAPSAASGSPSNPKPRSVRGSKNGTPRTYPLRKQFILESYHDLFTSNQVCLLFRHHALNSRQWNSIRGQIKSLGSSSPRPSAGFGEYKYQEPEPNQQAGVKDVPKMEVLRTKMILPVLRRLLGESKIDKTVYKALVSNKHLPPSERGRANLSGALFSITQPRFEPEQIKRIIAILAPYTTPTAASAPAPAVPKSAKIHPNQQPDSKHLDVKVKFLIGLVDRSTICKDQHALTKLADLDSLDSLRAQIVALVTHPAQALTRSLDLARASCLVRTLNSHIRTQKLAETPEDPAPSPPPA